MSHVYRTRVSDWDFQATPTEDLQRVVQWASGTLDSMEFNRALARREQAAKKRAAARELNRRRMASQKEGA